MSELQKAIEEITYMTKAFPKKAFQVITANREEAIPYLREALLHAFPKRKELEEDYQLHFYALYLLGEFQDREFFQKIMEFVSLPEDELDNLIGDCVTSGLEDILYNTYNGDIELLKKPIQNRDISEFARSAMLDVMGQLYLDGNLAENEWKDFLKQNVYDGRDYDYLYDAVGSMICQCHFMDMLPEIRYMFEKDLLDEMYMGKYDSYIDAIFQYQEDEERFCNSSINAADLLCHWAMFEEKEGSVPDKHEKDFGKLIRAMEKEFGTPAVKIKTGRNDPCPCGSGKKYKFCCLNKPKDEMDLIESKEERCKWLKDYPYTGPERLEGRIYLEDYFDTASIEIDKILYLALMNRPGFFWDRNREAEAQRTKAYLYLAFQKCMARMETEQIPSFSAYDEKYSIHYRCAEWINELERLLKENNDTQMYKEVTEWAGRKELLWHEP